MRSTLTFSIFALLLAAACSRADQPPAANGTTTPSAPPARPAHPPPAPAAGSMRTLAAGNQAFAADLHAQLRSRSGNFAYSPASISMALAMTYAGARGTTADQMRRTMHFDVLPDADLHAGFATLLSTWNDPAEQDYELRVANRLFGDATMTYHAPFLAVTRDTYGAPLEEVDFIGAFEPARAHINAWVAGQTRDRIRNLLPPGSLDSDTRLVLTNAVYFKGRWESRFETRATRDATFVLADGREVQVPTMHQTATFDHAAVDGVQVLQMPYVGGDLAMVVIVPDGDLASVERRLDSAAIDRWIATLQRTEVDVALPRFRIDPPEPIAMRPTFEAMGMTEPFLTRADLGGISDLRPLFISNVFHKAFVEVNEEGTEAAAATAVVVATESASMNPSFRADRPFLFLIRDLRNDSLLFVGRVADPRS